MGAPGFATAETTFRVAALTGSTRPYMTAGLRLATAGFSLAHLDALQTVT